MSFKLANKQRLIYGQTYRILEHLGSKYIEKLPEKVASFFETFKEYSPELKSADDETILKETVDLIAALNLKYWEANDERKARLKDIYINNEIVKRASKIF